MENIGLRTDNSVMELQNNTRRKKIKLKKYHCKDGWTQIHRLGLCRQSLEEESGVNESKSHRWLRIGILIGSVMFIVKQFSLLMIYHNQEKEGERDVIDKNMFKWFGDLFFFEPRIRKHMIITVILAAIRLLQTQLLYHRMWRNGNMRCIPTIKLFQVFAGMRSSKELGLGCKEVIKLMKR